MTLKAACEDLIDELREQKLNKQNASITAGQKQLQEYESTELV